MYVSHIQLGHIDFLPPQVCGSQWQVFQLGDHNYSHELIALLDLKKYFKVFLNPYFVYCCLVFIAFNGSEFIYSELVLGYVRKLSVGHI